MKATVQTDPIVLSDEHAAHNQTVLQPSTSLATTHCHKIHVAKHPEKSVILISTPIISLGPDTKADNPTSVPEQTKPKVSVSVALHLKQKLQTMINARLQPLDLTVHKQGKQCPPITLAYKNPPVATLST